MLCKQCGNAIGGFTQNEAGELAKVSRYRKLCFECSPIFGNKKRLQCKNGEVLRECKFCKKDFPALRGRTFCGSCNANRRRFRVKKKCLDYKGNKCCKCGYNTCERCLTFHHRDPKEKKFNISGSHCRKWEDLKLELDKCDLLCHNCHTELHCEEDSKGDRHNF